MSEMGGGTPQWMRFEAALALVLAVSSIVGGLMEGLSWTVIFAVALAVLVLVPQALDRYKPVLFGALKSRGWLPSRLDEENNAPAKLVPLTGPSAEADSIPKLMVREKILESTFEVIENAAGVLDEEKDKLTEYFHKNGRLKDFDRAMVERWERALAEITSAHRESFKFGDDLTLHSNYLPSEYPLADYGNDVDAPASACRLFWDQVEGVNKNFPDMAKRMRHHLGDTKRKLRQFADS